MRHVIIAIFLLLSPCLHAQNQPTFEQALYDAQNGDSSAYGWVGFFYYEGKSVARNYSEAIKLCEFIKTITDTAPVWSLIGDIYRALKMYGKSIEAYKYYLNLNEDDDEATETLKEIYEEALN